MTAPLFFLDVGRLASAVVGQEVLLSGDEGRHAATVTRLRVGEQVLLADGTGRVAAAEIASVGRAELSLRLLQIQDRPAPEPRFVLVQALAKGDRDAQAIEAATELGVDEVVPWQADRSIVIWRGERADKSRRKWAALVLAASKQSRRATTPVVGSLSSRRDLARRIGDAALTLVLHEEATSGLASIDLPDRGDVLLVVGPEGGVSPDELAAFEAAGAVPVRLGDTVLRSSSAGPAALAVLAAATRWR